jgi:hypothetical protein
MSGNLADSKTLLLVLTRDFSRSVKPDAGSQNPKPKAESRKPEAWPEARSQKPEPWSLKPRA